MLFMLVEKCKDGPTFIFTNYFMGYYTINLHEQVFNKLLLQKKEIFMEYKYRMLCAPSFSNESIQFKLSQTFMQSCAQLSPTKPRDSLTYTVSMQTIQDQEFSPVKQNYQRFLYLKQFANRQYFASDPRFPSDQSIQLYDINGNQPIVSIRINPDSKQIIQVQNEQQKQIKRQSTHNSLETEKDKNIENKLFTKKSILKINNLVLSPQLEESETGRKNLRMGKVMTKIHSQMKQSQSNNRSVGKSNKKLKEPSQEVPQIKKRSISMHQADTIQKTELYNKQSINLLTDSINENSRTEKIQNFESLPSNCSKISYLNKTNSSSNGNCSPELTRKKTNQTIKYQKQSIINPKEVFLSDRHEKQKKILPSNKYSDRGRERILSTIGPGESKLKRSKFLSKLQSCNDKETEKDRKSINDSISIVALKLNLSQRNNNCPLIRNRSISQNQKINQVQSNAGKVNSIQNCIKKQLSLQNLQINTDILINNGQKRGWRKLKENVPKKLFYVS